MWDGHVDEIRLGIRRRLWYLRAFVPRKDINKRELELLKELYLMYQYKLGNNDGVYYRSVSGEEVWDIRDESF